MSNPLQSAPLLGSNLRPPIRSKAPSSAAWIWRKSAAWIWRKDEWDLRVKTLKESYSTRLR